MWSGVESKPLLFFLDGGEARRRGGDTIMATSNPPPYYDRLEGCSALGGRITTSSPRCLSTYENVTFCNGWGAGVFVPFLVCLYL